MSSSQGCDDDDVFIIPREGEPPEKQRLYIPSEERDRELLRAGSWPGAAQQKAGGHWRERGRHLFRNIEVRGEGPGALHHRLWEALLPFPNSPVYATHKRRERAFEFEKGWRNLHTMRVIGSREPNGKHDRAEKIRHIYLIHNGLNETNDLLFHYRLAAWIVGNRPDAVCILRPLPGHLTRFPFDSPYAEQPLDGYLRDPAELFRQFLRYMQETQWLLSALVPRSHYAVLAGTRLLAEARPMEGKPSGRATPSALAKAIKTDWDAAFSRSDQIASDSGLQQSSSPHGSSVGLEAVRYAIDELRSILNWAPVLAVGGPEVAEEESQLVTLEAPCVHVVGYSMGGFMAQAAFFAWPFAISSCTNLFAGGALRDLAPTAFAHPEEWQAVLHGLRYELDRAYREHHLDTSDSRIAGIAENDFGYFTRIFYEVYLQYYRGGYASRVSGYSRRMLFIVGGGDPIVRTKNVLDAGPPEGMTLLQIADVSHFPTGRAHGAPDGGRVESEQRQYWLPEVGRVIGNFSERAEVLLHKTLSASWGADKNQPLSDADAAVDDDDTTPFEPPPDKDPTMLASVAFAHELRALVACARSDDAEADPKATQVSGRGWLLIARNEIPPVFLGPIAFRYYGQAVHHSEEQIGQYVRLLRQRAQQLVELRDRTSLLIPSKARGWLEDLDVQRTFFSKSETPSAARMPNEQELASMWSHFDKEWIKTGAARMFDAREYKLKELGELGEADARRPEARALFLTVLPDVWIAFSADALNEIRGPAKDDRDSMEPRIVEWATRLAEKKGEATPTTTRKDGNQHDARGQLQRWLDSGDLIAIAVSAGELNPRFRGHRLKEFKDAKKAIIHWALAHSASKMGVSTARRASAVPTPAGAASSRPASKAPTTS